MSSPLIVLQTIAYLGEKQEREGTQTPESAGRQRVTLSTRKITNTSDWMEIYPKIFFSQLQFVVEVKKRKQTAYKNSIFPYIYLLDIAEVNCFYRHS